MRAIPFKVSVPSILQISEWNLKNIKYRTLRKKSINILNKIGRRETYSSDIIFSENVKKLTFYSPK